MTIEKFFEIADIGEGDYIVRLKYKYNWEKEYRYSNEAVSYEFDRDSWVWLNDWREGETDVEVVAYVPADDVIFPFISWYEMKGGDRK